MEETAYAKLNLALRVLGREPDGYHSIDTVFAFAEHGDLLRVEEGEELTLRVVGPFAADLGSPDDNLVLRAACALAVDKGAALTLDKRLPVASGIGGGSADAAAALRLLNRWWGLGHDQEALLALARPLGADVPACLLSRTARGGGRGDRLTPLDEHRGTPVLLVNPRIPLSTADVFARWRGVETGGNDLEPVALELAPVIGEVLGLLNSRPGVTLARMSGSGATCFALFEDESSRDSAEGAIRALKPGWWTLSSRLR